MRFWCKNKKQMCHMDMPMDYNVWGAMLDHNKLAEYVTYIV